MSNLFTVEIKGKQFNFQPVKIGDQYAYHVDVKDTDGVRWEFRMQQQPGNNWVMEAEKLPDWIKSEENTLKAAIEEHD